MQNEQSTKEWGSHLAINYYPTNLKFERLAANIENAKEGDIYDAPVELKQKVCTNFYILTES